MRAGESLRDRRGRRSTSRSSPCRRAAVPARGGRRRRGRRGRDGRALRRASRRAGRTARAAGAGRCARPRPRAGAGCAWSGRTASGCRTATCRSTPRSRAVLPLGGGGISLVSQSGAYGMAVHDLAHEEHVRFAKVCASGQHRRRRRRRAARRARRRPRHPHDVPAAGVGRRRPGLRRGRAAGDGAHSPCSCSRPAARRRVLVPRRRTPRRWPPAGAVWSGALRQAGAVEVRSGQELLDAARALDGQPLPAGRPGRDHHQQRRHRAWSSRTCWRTRACRPRAVTPRCRTGCVRCCRRTPRRRTRSTSRPAWSLFPTIYPALVDLLARSGEVDAVVVVLLQRSATDAVDRARRRGRRAGACAATAWPCRCTRAGWRRAPPTTWHASCRRRACRCCRGRRAPPARWRWPVPPRWRGIASPSPPPGRSPRARSTSIPTSTSPTRRPRPSVLRRFGVDVVAAVECRTRRRGRGGGDVPGRGQGRPGGAPHRGGRRTPRAHRSRARCAPRPPSCSRGRPRCWCRRSSTASRWRWARVRDPDFGPVVMVGSGGIWVEALGDTAFALAPLTLAEARELHRVAAGAARRCTGARGQEPADLDALAAARWWPRATPLVGPARASARSTSTRCWSPREGAVAVDWSLHPSARPGDSRTSDDMMFVPTGRGFCRQRPVTSR